MDLQLLLLAKQKGFNPKVYTKGTFRFLLQTWLREIHKIDIIIDVNGDTPEDRIYEGSIIHYFNRDFFGDDTLPSNDYIKCLDGCLIEALKLIK